MIKSLVRSNLGNQASSTFKGSIRWGNPQEHLFGSKTLVQWNTSMASLQPEDSTDSQDRKRFKGHGILAPFTMPWETTEVGPLVIQKSEGCYLYDINGRKYLDFIAGTFCTALGGSESRLVEAAAKQLNIMPFYQSSRNYVNKPALDLSKELLETFTARKMAMVFFSNSGSVSNDTQVKLAWYYNNALGRPKKKKIIARERAYHGTTLISASLSGLPAVHESFDLPAPFVLRIDAPHYWRNHIPGETEEQFAARLASSLENLILKEGPETIAAFIAEPVMGPAGAVVPPTTYFEKVQDILKKYDILFIADEVANAFGRCGTMFGCDKFNIMPDLVSLAKALSSGYAPISAVLISPKVAEVVCSYGKKLGYFSHGFSTSPHPVSCSIALEAVKIYKERKIHEQVQKISPRFLDGLKAFSDSPIIGEIRGIGLFATVEFTQNKSPNEPFPPEWRIGRYFESQCRKRGLLARVISDAIGFCPALIITPDEVDKFLSIFGEALKETEDWVRKLKMKHQEQRIRS